MNPVGTSHVEARVERKLCRPAPAAASALRARPDTAPSGVRGGRPLRPRAKECHPLPNAASLSQVRSQGCARPTSTRMHAKAFRIVFIQGGTGLILARLCIGLGLASFVTCQVTV